jgi:rhodanese-related sulfurtransferase
MRWRRVLLLIAIGSVLGLAWNALSRRGIALTANVYLRPGDETIDILAAKRRFDKGAILFVDARVQLVWELQRIPGAVSLPQDEFDAAFARLEPTLRGRYDIVVYCDGFACEASHDVARRLKAHGIPAAVLEGGFPVWRDAGYPTTTGSAS